MQILARFSGLSKERQKRWQAPCREKGRCQEPARGHVAAAEAGEEGREEIKVGKSAGA